MTRIAVCAAVGLFALMLALRILVWQWRPHKRPCWLFGHDKKYVALKVSGCVPANSPESSGRGFPCGDEHNHKMGDKGIYLARWSCRRCPVLGEECLGDGQDWTIEPEQLVPDVKKWANWGQEKK